MQKASSEKQADKIKKRWNFVPFYYSAPHGLIDLVQIVGTPYVTVQIHRINFPDVGGYYHDHPWTFYSMILRGGYDENIWDNPYDMDNVKTRRRRLLSIHKIGHESAHRIFRSKPKTLTLFVTGPWVRNGFRFYRDGEDFDISFMMKSSSSGSNILNMR